MIRCLFIAILLVLGGNAAFGQEADSDNKLFELVLQNMDSSDFALSRLQETPWNVVFFLSPECPLCENYSLTIRTLREQISSDSVAFYGIFSGTYFSPKLIQTYLDRYNPDVIPLLDPAYQSKRVLDANVTPEAFLINQQGEVLYRGSIDNWIPALGKKRTIITRHYLQDALHASMKGTEIPIAQTKAIGCFIE